MKRRVIALFLTLVLLLGALPGTALAENDGLGTVRVIAENTTFTSPEAAWTGKLFDTTVELTEDMTAITAFAAAAKKMNVEVVGVESNYISSIGGLAAYDGGSMSGWMGTLDDWFTNAGLGDFSVASGDLRDGSVIKFMYTSNGYGEDIGGSWGNTNTSLKALGFSEGTLTPSFASDTVSYTLYLDGSEAETTISFEAANKNYQAHAYVNDYAPSEWGYRSGETLSVRPGDTIYVGVGNKNWPSMNSGGDETRYTIDVKTYGSARVIVENNTFIGAGAPWSGTLIDETVSLSADMTAMDAIAKALRDKGIECEGADSGYITSVNGLAAFDGGSMSGWMGTLDDWFTNEGLGEFSVASGDLRDGSVIRLMYTSNGYGEDIGGSWSNMNTSLKALGFSEGTLTPSFKTGTTSYVLYLDPDTTETTISYEAMNKNFQARAYVGAVEPSEWGYRSGETLTVSDGDTIYVSVGNENWPSMNGEAEETRYAIKVSQRCGSVRVVVENNTYTVEGEAPWVGTLADETVDLTSGMTAMDAIEAAMAKAGVTLVTSYGYVSSIGGLAHVDDEFMSGWMGTLDDWFTSSGFGDYSVKNGYLRDGSVIRLMYSVNGGSDVGGSWGNYSTLLKSLSFSGGRLTPSFKSDTTSYTLTLPEGQTKTTISYEALNKYYQARAYLGEVKPSEWGYRSGETLTVSSGDTIYVSIGNENWPSMNSANLTLETRYTITVAGGVTPEPSTVTVRFDSLGGSSVAPQSVEKNGLAVRPDDPERAGYVFTGWYTDHSCRTLWTFALDTVAHDMTLYAGWREIPTADDYSAALEKLLAYITYRVPAPSSGSIGGEWAVMAEARGGVDDSVWYQVYLDDIAQRVADCSGRLSESTYTEYERVAMALTALGENAAAFRASDGKSYDLVSPLLEKSTSGEYVYKLSEQGTNATAFALIALDAGNYLSGEDGSALRSELVKLLLSQQMENGAWSISGAKSDAADIDVTAMIVQALSGYTEVSGVSAAIDAAVSWLGSTFRDGSGYGSSEASSQVIIALSALGRDADNDESFKTSDEMTLLAELLTYADDGSDGFLDKKTPGAKANQMASEQAALALIAYDRFKSGENKLYDMTDAPQPKPETAKEVEDMISAITEAGVDESSYKAIAAARQAYDRLSEADKQSVGNLNELEDAERVYASILKSEKSEANKRLSAYFNSLDLEKYGSAAEKKLVSIMTQAQKDIKNAKSCEQVERILDDAIDDMSRVKASGITVTFRLIGALTAEKDVDLSSSSYVPEYVTWIETTSYDLASGATVYELFTEALSDADITASGASKNYVDTIYAPDCLGGYALSEFTNGRRSGWMYTVNGKHPEVGLKDCELEDGDEVVWHYVNDYSHEVKDWAGSKDYPALGTGKYYNDWLDAADISPESYVKQLLGRIVTVSAGGSYSPKLEIEDIGSGMSFTFTPNKGYHIKRVTVDGENMGDVASVSVKKLTVSTRIRAEFAPDGLPFDDVSVTDWFYDDVLYVYENGLFSGTGSTTFSPNAAMTRAMLVTVLYRLEGEPATPAQTAFSDVSPDSYYAKAVAWASANGIVNGVGESSFAPQQNVTREQIAAILCRYAAFKGQNVNATDSLDRFSDAGSVSDYAVSAMQWAVGKGIISGYNGGLAPADSATRAQVAAMLHRFAG